MSNPGLHTFDQKSTCLRFPWPATITGLERILLSTKGDLQNALSAFFAAPIDVTVVYATASTAQGAPISFVSQEIVDSVSPENPIYQRRQVLLSCQGTVVCTCTSEVIMSSPEVAQTFLVDKYPIGQTFKKLQQPPLFELLQVGFGNTHEPAMADSLDWMWRQYRLSIPNFECNIHEVFYRKHFSTSENYAANETVTAAKKDGWRAASLAGMALLAGTLGSVALLGSTFRLPSLSSAQA